MSVAAMNWAMAQHVGATGPKMTLILLADIADPCGVLFAGGAYLAEIAECNRSTIVGHLQKLEDAGFVRRFERRTPSGERTSTVTMLGADLADRGDMRDPREHEMFGRFFMERLSRDYQHGETGRLSRDSQQEPEVNRSPAPNGAGDVRARAKPLRIGGKAIDPSDPDWLLTRQILTEVNRQTGRNVGALTASNEVSEAARYIFKAIQHLGNRSFEDHQRMIAITIASKWWGGTERASYQQIYSPKVIEKNWHRQPSDGPSRQAVRDARDARKEEYEQTRQRRYEALKRVAGLSDDEPGPATANPDNNGGHHANDGRRVGGDRGDSAGLLAG
jgi:hypothetical protein